MKRTNPSISAILNNAPTSHAKLPPLPASLRSSTDGSVQSTAGVDRPLPGAVSWSDADGTGSSTAVSQQTQQQEQQQRPHVSSVNLNVQDHLLLRPPAVVAVPEDDAHQQPQQCEQQQSQQQRSSWLEFLNVPQFKQQSRCSKDVPTQEPERSNTALSGSSDSNSWKSRRVRLLQLLDSPRTSWVLMVMTLFVIFQEDFKYAVLPPTADVGFEATTLAMLVLFLVEIGCSCVVRPHFFLSFYFWLDTVAVLSLAFELPALRAVLLLGATQEYVDLNSADNYLMAAGAQALVSSKAGRAAKMVRLFRQLQLIRLFKQIEVRQRLKRALQADAMSPESDNGQELAALEAQVMAKYQGASQSRVGQKLSDLTMKRVISGVLAMLVVLPALEISSNINGRDTPLALGGLQMLHNQALTGGTSSIAFNSSLKAFEQSIQYELAGQLTGNLLLLMIANTTYIHNYVADQVTFTQVNIYNNTAKVHNSNYRRYLEMQAVAHSSWVCPLSSLRLSSSGGSKETAELVSAAAVGDGFVIVDTAAAHAVVAAVTSHQSSDVGDIDTALPSSGCVKYQSFVLLDIKWALQAQSVYGIARTMFLACLLAVGAMLIHQDTFKLVLQPVQRMVERVREMAEDPLMLAAVRISTPSALPSSSGAGAAESSKDGASALASRNSLAPADGTAAGLVAKEQQQHQQQQQLRQAVESKESSPCQSKRPSIFSFWPGAKIHAVVDGAFDAASNDGSSNNSALASKVAAGNSHQREQQQCRPSGRLSGTQFLLDSTRRLSVGLVASVSAAGQVAAKLGQQLRERTSAMRRLVLSGGGDTDDDTAQGQYETRLLEQSIYKICALLAVGFGDAGAEVIAENIKKEGDLNPIVPGKKMVAVFGFCDIRRFTDTTEVLQEGVMEFVNTIAHLVHGAVAARGGAANKNIGDAFLLVWKLPKGMDEQDIHYLHSSGNKQSSGSGAGPSRLKSAALPWGGSDGASSGSDSDEEFHSHADGKVHVVKSSAGSCTTSQPGATCKATKTSGAGDNAAGFDELSRQLSTVMQQQLTLNRAASGVAELLGASNKAARQHSSGSFIPGSCGNSNDGGVQPLNSVAGHSSSLGLKRAVMSLKTVKPMHLSAAAKTTIINTIADNALASFVIIQVAISVSRLLDRYSRRSDLNARMPGFRVQMGFGLHVGWAIEGAIGSEYKIDASYLSPNVNLASRLEAATKQYGVPLLLSKDFVECLSPAVRSKVRQIDCVTVKGSNQPLGLFCYDIDMDAAKAAVWRIANTNNISNGSCPTQQAARHSRDSNTGAVVIPSSVKHSLAGLPGAAGAARKSVVIPAGTQTLASSEESDCVDEAELLLTQEYEDDWLDNPVLAESWGLTWTFKEEFDDAFQLYLEGKWADAKQAFELCLSGRTNALGQHVEDGPSRTLLSVMETYGFEAPPDWKGVRELTEK